MSVKLHQFRIKIRLQIDFDCGTDLVIETLIPIQVYHLSSAHCFHFVTLRFGVPAFYIVKPTSRYGFCEVFGMPGVDTKSCQVRMLILPNISLFKEFTLYFHDVKLPIVYDMNNVAL